MRIGIAADHGGFTLKSEIIALLRSEGHEVEDFGAFQLDLADDYPDFVIPLAQAVAAQRVARGIAICGSGVGACIVANKIPNIRAALIHDSFSAHQGVEDDDMNLLCLGARICGASLAAELIRIYLAATFSGAARHQRRLAKLRALEQG
jgi:RpiB/LacA/LacB family sugar-phosphate isomerase